MLNIDMGRVATQSEFLTKDDTDFNGMNVTINNLTEEEVGQEKEKKYAIHFVEPVKAMVLNVTNIKILCALLGPNSGGWLNQRICVYADPTISFGGQVVGGLRIRPCQQPTQGGQVIPPLQQPQQQQPMFTPEQQGTIAAAQQTFGTPQQPIQNSTGEDVPF